LLDRGLAEAGIDRSQVFVTNAVKHFKFEERGKRRIHKKPSAGEVKACHPWLEAELAFVKPSLIGLLGATAAQSVLGSDFRVSTDRGRILALPSGQNAIATVHPSAILRALEADEREAEFRAFVGDLLVMRQFLAKSK
jgi:DNA polymerase